MQWVDVRQDNNSTYSSEHNIICLVIFIYFRREIESLIFSSQDRLEIFISIFIFIATSFEDKIFISTMPYGHETSSFPFFNKALYNSFENKVPIFPVS